MDLENILNRFMQYKDKEIPQSKIPADRVGIDDFKEFPESKTLKRLNDEGLLAKDVKDPIETFFKIMDELGITYDGSFLEIMDRTKFQFAIQFHYECYVTMGLADTKMDAVVMACQNAFFILKAMIYQNFE